MQLSKVAEEAALLQRENGKDVTIEVVVPASKDARDNVAVLQEMVQTSVYHHGVAQATLCAASKEDTIRAHRLKGIAEFLSMSVPECRDRFLCTSCLTSVSREEYDTRVADMQTELRRHMQAGTNHMSIVPKAKENCSLRSNVISFLYHKRPNANCPPAAMTWDNVRELWVPPAPSAPSTPVKRVAKRKRTK